MTKLVKGEKKKVRLVTCVPYEVSEQLRAIAKQNCANNLSYLATHIFEQWLKMDDKFSGWH